MTRGRKDPQGPKGDPGPAGGLAAYQIVRETWTVRNIIWEDPTPSTPTWWNARQGMQVLGGGFNYYGGRGEATQSGPDLWTGWAVFVENHDLFNDTTVRGYAICATI